MYIERESLLLDIEYDNKKDVEYINNVFNKWDKIKEDISHFSEILKNGWKTDIKKESKEHYFG